MEPQIDQVLHFWLEECTPAQHYKADPAFDRLIEERFGALHEEASKGALEHWAETAQGALALILLLDQFSRNIHRGTAGAFAQDEKGLATARLCVARGHDMAFEAVARSFFYMPFMHAEDLAVQEECVTLFSERLPESSNVRYAVIHRDIIAKFGRFPHRNRVLGRESTPEEIAYLEDGGFNPKA